MSRCLDEVKQTVHLLSFNKEQTYIGRIKDEVLLRASCPSPFGPAKAVQNCPRQYCAFLGYRIGEQSPQSLCLAWKTWANHFAFSFTKSQQLYEQGAGGKPHCSSFIGEEVKRWLVWVRSGVKIELPEVIRQRMASDLGKMLKRFNLWMSLLISGRVNMNFIGELQLFYTRYCP